MNARLLQLPVDGLGSTKQTPVVQVKPSQFHRLDDFVGYLTGVGMRTPRPVLWPGVALYENRGLSRKWRFPALKSRTRID
jgi:hypothetical protein